MLLQCHVPWYTIRFDILKDFRISSQFSSQSGCDSQCERPWKDHDTLQRFMSGEQQDIIARALELSSPMAYGHFAMDMGYHVIGSCWSVSLNVCFNILPDLSTSFMSRFIREPLCCLAAAFFMAVPGGFSHCGTWPPATCHRRTSPSCCASTECGPRRIGSPDGLWMFVVNANTCEHIFFACSGSHWIAA